MQLHQVWDSTLLSSSKCYQIDGVLYRYLYKTDSIKHPQYVFRPQPGQRKSTDLKLNRNKLTTRCYEVEGMTIKAEVVDNNAIQMKLF
ncbi:hypothetical protein [Tolypothrix sp. VBCCA 56010]|uniref:hypothetical protein n=1 Tax=Tolypothrix sp. VBCCA 56010 TaxID=3137731 RepID=UPI003D7EC342